MKKALLTVSIIIMGVITIFAGLRFLSGSEDAWICENGGWTKHGNPSTPMPQELCDAIDDAR